MVRDERHREPARAAESIALRFLGCAGRATRRRLRRSSPARSCALYLRRELGWPLNELGRIRLHKETSPAPRKPCWPLIAPDGIPNRLSRWCVWPRATWPPRLPPWDAVERPVRVPSRERPPNTACNAPLLQAQVEIEVAAGDIGRAQSAADELEIVANRFESKALVASAALARGRVRLAEGDASAEQSLSEALGLWNEVGAPYEAALTRLCLAEAHAATDNQHRAGLERQAARTILEGIEAAPSVTHGYTSSITMHPTSSRL